MNTLLATILALAAIVFTWPRLSFAATDQYQTIDFYVQQMIVHAVANETTGVQTFREQLENLKRPEPGDAAKARPFQQQGLEQLAHNNLKEALAAWRQAFISDPTNPDIASQLSITYLRLGRFGEAERLAVYTLSLAPTQMTAWLTLGEIYGQIGDVQRSAGAFINAYQFTQARSQVTAQLQTLLKTDGPESLRRGAQQALQSVQATAAQAPSTPNPAPAPNPVPASKPVAVTPNTSTTDPKTVPANATSIGNPASTHSASTNLALGSIKDALKKLAGPGDPPPPTLNTPPTVSANSDDAGQRIYQQSIPLTCLIVTFRNGKTDTLGSGLLVSTTGLVITNQHVIEKADNLAVRCGTQESAASVHKRSKEPDLALLTTTLKSDKSFVFNEIYSQDLIGRDVFVIGNPYGLEGTFSTGVISGLRQIEGVRYIQISAPISPGNSGGPVILRDGTIIGIAAMGLKKGQNLNFAIASVEVIASNLFDRNQMKTQRSLSGK